MAEIASQHNKPEDELEFTEYTTENGGTYRVGRPKGSADAKEKADNAPEGDQVGIHGKAFSVNVNWQAGSAGNTDSSFASRTGIDKWNISIGGVIYKFRISFHTTQTYDYHFRDQTDDEYECNVWTEGWHYIDYNSDQPNMYRVRGQ